jgi:hypothetical protein
VIIQKATALSLPPGTCKERSWGDFLVEGSDAGRGIARRRVFDDVCVQLM